MRSLASAWPAQSDAVVVGALAARETSEARAADLTQAARAAGQTPAARAATQT